MSSIKINTFLLCLLSFSSYASEPEIERFAKVIAQQQRANRTGHDVHTFNGMVKPFAGILNQCNAKLALDIPVSYDVALDAFLTYGFLYAPSDMNEVVIAQLRGYLKQGPDADIETGMTVSHMISAIYNYMHKDKDLSSTTSLLFFYLLQNKEENGGCFPGYAGRLMVVNGLFVAGHYESQREAVAAAKEKEKADQEKLDLEIALALSASEVSNK